MSNAQEVLEVAVKNQPKRRGCLRGCLVTVLILALPIYWFCFHTTPLRVAKETTYVLGPMTSDGKRIDYFRAMEERYYPPEMKTDDNGYRMIVRACGANIRSTACCSEEQLFDPEPFRLQIYEKLGLDPNIKPTMKIESPWHLIAQYDKENPPAEGEATLGKKYQDWVQLFWTFDDFPMFKDWLDENTAGLDLLTEAVRKPAFYVPYVREDENTPIFESAFRLDAMQYIRDWARALHARAQYRLGIGDIDGVINDIVTIHHLARHAGRQGTLVSGLVGLAIEGMGVAIGIGSNPEFPPTKEQIERLVAELDALPPRQTLSEALESERYFGLAALQDMWWGIDIGIADVYHSILGPLWKWTIDINIAMAKQNKVYDAMTIPGATLDGNTLEEFIELTWNRWNPLPLLFVRSRTIRIMDTKIALTIPALQAGSEAWRRVECIENMQRLTLALLLYEKEHGAIPEDDWREAIRPYLGENAEKYFRCPSHGLAQGETNYAMISGVSNPQPTPYQFLLVEVMQPQKLGEGDGRILLEEAKFSQENDGLGSHHTGGINVGLRSGAVLFIVKNTKPEELQSLLDGTATKLL